MKGYKAFNKGLICRGKQYAENTVFEEDKAEICSYGMHFCKEPLEVLEYYPLVDDNGTMTEFAEVEALDECKTDDEKKYCTKKLKIGAKITFAQLVNASIDIESIKESKLKTTSKNNAKIGSSGYSAKIGSSGDYAKIGSSGYYAKIGSSGYSAKIGSSGDSAQIGSSGDYAQIGSSGDSAQIGSSGDYAKIGSSGYYAKIGSSGYYAQIGSSGDSAQIGSSGYSAKIDVSGENTVAAAIGIDSKIKGVIGTWITLAEYERKDGKHIPKCVKSAQIDGEILKADTWYILKDGEFVEVDE